MKERGFRIKDVAEKIGYSYAMFSYMINDQRSIKDTDVIRIAGVLGVTPNELFGMDSDAEMPLEITIKAEPKKIASLISGIQGRQYQTNKLSKTAFDVIRKFVEDFGIDDFEINTMINELKDDLLDE